MPNGRHQNTLQNRLQKQKTFTQFTDFLLWEIKSFFHDLTSEIKPQLLAFTVSKTVQYQYHGELG